jgi:hypothetical protein
VCTRAIIGKTEALERDERREAIRWSPAWPDHNLEPNTSAWDLLRRLEAGHWHEPCARGYMQGINLDRQAVRIDLAMAGWAFASARSTDLMGAELSYANLSDADLNGAFLIGADVGGANLSGTNLSGADLSHANLRGADLNDAILSRANLRAAEFSLATGLTRSQLSAARNVAWDSVSPDLPEA